MSGTYLFTGVLCFWDISSRCWMSAHSPVQVGVLELRKVSPEECIFYYLLNK